MRLIAWLTAGLLLGGPLVRPFRQLLKWHENDLRHIRRPVLDRATIDADASESSTESADFTANPDLGAELELLVHRLGDSEFTSREMATERLVEIGVPAMAALERGRHDLDREVRLRCERIMARVQVDKRRRQLARFRNHQETISTSDALPGWSQFEGLLGEGELARRLFADMLEEEWDFLENLDADPATASEALINRCAEVQNARSFYRQTVSTPTIAALLPAASNERLTITDEVSRQLYFLCMQIPSFRNALQERTEQKNQPLRRLTGAWIRRGAGSVTAKYCVPLALRYYLPEGVELARNVLLDRSHPAPVRQNAILLLAKMGSVEHLMLLDSLLDDNEECIRRTDQKTKKTIVTQIRDVALAAMIHLSGKDPAKDFDFQYAKDMEYSVFVPHSLGFSDDETRGTSRDKWEQFRRSMDSATENDP